VAVGLVVLLAPAGLAAQSGVLSPAYESVVRRYAAGDRQGAVANLADWPEGRLRDEFTALRALVQASLACPGGCGAANVWQRIPIEAALMLHSDAAQEVRGEGRLPRLHESAAVEIARLMKQDPSRRTFARRWYEAMAGLAQGENRWGEALEWAERGLEDYPDSAGMHLVLGSIEETLGARLGFRAHLERAERALRSAVAADPSLGEARLRLGRVCWRLGETTEARSFLQDVLDREPERETALLAHLFLGRLDEDAGRLDEATQAYEAALALDPSAQAARIALSHVRLRRGDTASARAEAETALGFSGYRLRQDPFWLYPWGPSVGVEERLEALRREASS
jgi:tetratricopeptide (TPR) repeat protein